MSMVNLTSREETGSMRNFNAHLFSSWSFTGTNSFNCSLLIYVPIFAFFYTMLIELMCLEEIIFCCL